MALTLWPDFSQDRKEAPLAELKLVVGHNAWDLKTLMSYQQKIPAGNRLK